MAELATDEESDDFDGHLMPNSEGNLNAQVKSSQNFLY